jgi:uncharacterized protein
MLAHSAGARAHVPPALVRDPRGILDLPPGFSYRVLSRQGELMSDGYRVPGHIDGMGVFEGPRDTLVLMRNHEIALGDRASGPYLADQPIAPEAWDPTGFGGVSRVVVDRETLAVRSTNLVLTGTFWNCAGGLSPWGWLSCEEIFAPNHGYVFVCPTDATRLAPARPIKAFGKFRHEAATTDPHTLITYLTEDIGDASFYRFVPRDAGHPFEGKLQGLAVRGMPRFDTSNMAPHSPLPVHWVDVDDPDPSEDTVRLQAQARGAAVFRRNEGLWLHGDDLFLTATPGGPLGRGQIFRVRHTPEANAHLELIAVVEDTAVLDMPDNLTVSPSGHVYAAEDGLEGKYLRRIGLDGTVADVARNALSLSELAGPCFAPDGKTLFLNIQHDGITLAISGPFDRHAALHELAPASAAGDARETGGLPPGLLGLGGGLTILALAALGARKRKGSRGAP